MSKEYFELKKESQHVELKIQTYPDSGTAQLIAVTSKTGGGAKAPLIEFYFKDGKYLIRIDGNDNVLDSEYLSLEFKRLLIEKQPPEKIAKSANALPMPSKADLTRRNKYMLFSSYKTEVNLRARKAIEGDQNFAKKYPRLPKEIYVELIRQYLKEDGYPGWYLYYDRTN